MTIRVAVDAMGGDHAPRIVLEGMALALRRFPELTYLLYGDEKEVQPLLTRFPELKEKTHFFHTEERVTGETKAIEALRSLKNSSMRLAIQAVAQGEADGVVSAGNTGAYMALSKIILKTHEAIGRPAITSTLPTEKGPCVLLDLGANLEADGPLLVQFAIMGEAYARLVLGVQKPSVALLNIGSEDLKGHEELKEAKALILQSTLSSNFYGFIEGDKIFEGQADVVVTDGFTGNVVLKTIEGTARVYKKFLFEAISSSILSKIGYVLSLSAYKKLKNRLDPRLYNGAPFLGLKGVAVKSHGGTDAVGFGNAVGVAVHMIQNKVNERIGQEIAHLNIGSREDLSSSKS